VAPAGELPAQLGVAQVLHARLVSLALQRQGLVEDETAATGKVRISAIVTGHFGHRDRRPERRL
jgi:hypothetical protein